MTPMTTERDDVPSDDQFADPTAAAERAAELGLGGVHWHTDGDGGRVWMPGGSHADYEDAVDQEAGLRDDWEDRLVQQDDPCWDGYTMVGLQDDGTPRCVPDDDVENYDESQAATDPADDITREEWVGETGPQGGDRWRNTETDEVVYDEPAGATDSGEEDDSDDSDALSPEMATRRPGRAVNDAHIAGSPDEDTTAVHFDTDVPSFRNIQSAFMYDETTGEFTEGAARFGEIDFENADEVGGSETRHAAESFENVIETADPPTDEYEADLGDFPVDAPHFRLRGAADADEMTEFMSRLTELVNERFFPYDATQRDDEVISQAAVEQQATFSEGEAVQWSWQGEPVHGRVAEVREEAATPEGSDQQITGDDGEPVYLIDEYDDRVEAFRRENVAKPESSLSPSRKDLPPRSDGNYVSSEAWESLRMPVRESEFSAAELDYVAAAYPDVLQQLDATTWALADGAAVYTAAVPARYDDIDLTPTEGMQAAAERALDAREGEDPPTDRLTRARARDIAAGERLRPDTWHEMDASVAPTEAWGGDAGASRAAMVTDQLDRADADAEMELQGAVAAQRSVESITEADSNRVDLDSLTDEERAAVEAEDFYLYGKASIEQWNRDESVYIQMDALEDALERFFESETAPGIISRHHQDIPVGVPVREFEFAEDTTLQIGAGDENDPETYQFAAGDVARSHVEDADGDGRPELWLAANISNDNEMAKKTRVLALRDDLDGFSVTIHRNEDRVTDEGGTIVTAADLHAVTIGTAEQIRNEGSEFDVASYSAAAIQRVRDRVASIVG